jgi:Glycosyltransferase
MNDEIKQHVYIVGSKSIGQYGGFETFVKRLIEQHKDNKRIQYHIACKANGDGCMDISKLPNVKIINKNEFEYCGAQCCLIEVPQKLGPAQAIVYDLKALKWCCEDIKKSEISHPIVYILACRIGPFIKKYVKCIHTYDGKYYVNPDGRECLRKKWSPLVRKYWKYSEKLMIKYCDLAVCDSVNIEQYIQEEYKAYNPNTTYIAYGSDVAKSGLGDNDSSYLEWLNKNHLKDAQYYISVGRFVPENNFETMIREFMTSKTNKDFAIITTKNDDFLEMLNDKLHFKDDHRIKFVGTVYDQKLLKKIRENAYGYFHGHEVGGTNPSLLEALGSTNMNLLLNVGFNKEVAEDAALYWSKETGSLSSLIDTADKMTSEERSEFGAKAKNRIINYYSWELIATRYNEIFR